jgi:hypothetical protein
MTSLGADEAASSKISNRFFKARAFGQNRSNRFITPLIHCNLFSLYRLDRDDRVANSPRSRRGVGEKKCVWLGQSP